MDNNDEVVQTEVTIGNGYSSLHLNLWFSVCMYVCMDVFMGAPPSSLVHSIWDTLAQEPDRRSNDRGPCRCFLVVSSNMCLPPLFLVRLAIHHIWYVCAITALSSIKRRQQSHDLKGVVFRYIMIGINRSLGLTISINFCVKFFAIWLAKSIIQ